VQEGSAGSAAAGYGVDRETRFDDALLTQADQNHLPPPFNTLYEDARRPPPDQGICQCDITSIHGNSFQAIDMNVTSTQPLTITLPPDYPGLASLAVGDVVFVAGRRTGSDTIQAFGVNAFPQDAGAANNPPLPRN
jgi:hypothetical protein